MPHQTRDPLSATSLKLPRALKAHLVAQAKRAGLSVHAYMVDALQRQVEDDRLRAQFVADALTAERMVRRTGRAHNFEDVRGYLESRLAGTQRRRPMATK